MAKQRTPGKWIKGLRPDMPVLETARRVLDRRLEAVEHLLPLALDDSSGEIEHIHRLRVATRRADAALRMFRPCIKRRRFDTARRRLRKIRRAAGAARICDVHALQFAVLRDAAPDATRPFYDDLIDWNADRRRAAQQSVIRAAKKYPPAKLAKGRAKLVRSLRVRRPIGAEERAAGNGDARTPTFADLAQSTLPGIAAAFRDAGGADLTLLSNLHQLRIAGKRLRYAMEVFGPGHDEEFDTHYGLVKSLQDELGEVNDAHEMLLRIADFVTPREATHKPSPDDGWRLAAAGALKRFHRTRDELAADFLAHWREGRWAPLTGLFPDDAAAEQGEEAVELPGHDVRPNGEGESADETVGAGPTTGKST